jgi:transcriptional regulator with XRE-family HTH domain
MKLNLSNEWLAKRAAVEERYDVSAGHVDLEGLLTATKAVEQPTTHVTSVELEAPRTAFGRLINLWRRKRGIRLDQLAERANVDLAELIAIEQDVRYIPEPRTVYQLSKTLGVPNERMLQLSGNVIVRDSHLGEEAVRFAARADSVEKLSKDEQRALEEFVKYLSEA